jgi:hypothetical protein
MAPLYGLWLAARHVLRRDGYRPGGVSLPRHAARIIVLGYIVAPILVGTTALACAPLFFLSGHAPSLLSSFCSGARAYAMYPLMLGWPVAYLLDQLTDLTRASAVPTYADLALEAFIAAALFALPIWAVVVLVVERIRRQRARRILAAQ